ncbi:MAG: exodeoxyribonuclease VII large subunit [Ruminococcaceae bacterium]|nr:exodeoxyribonuclease VII large subunit [Oscillospiraceae bacterium]
MAEKIIFSVTQINEYIKDLLEKDELLYTVSIRGEISNFTNHYKTGHFYFSLKDEGGVIRAVMFKGYASKLQFVPENGMKVVLTGKVSSYVKDGSYQVYAFTMEPDGIGSLYLAFEQLKKKLEAKGYFSPQYKKPIPRYPSVVGIVTSPTGAAIRDMINVSTRRFPLAKLVLFPCLVQGDGAPPQIASGIKFFNERYPVDVIIIGRGGGSLEELWAFNDERLAEVIFQSRVPIISAVGHETDFSISDFVSDLRAPTPSAAAELALPDQNDLKRQLANVGARLVLLANKRIESYAQRLESLKNSRTLKDLNTVIDDRRMDVLRLEQALDSSMEKLLQTKELLLKINAGKLGALDPLKIMSRGYAAAFDEEGNVVSSVETISEGDTLNLQLKDGKVIADVKEIRRETKNA